MDPNNQASGQAYPPYPHLDQSHQQQQHPQQYYPQAAQYAQQNPPPQHGYPNQPFYGNPQPQQFHQGPYAGQQQRGALFDDVGGAFSNQIMQQMGGGAIGQMVGATILGGGKTYVDKNFGRFMTLDPLKYYFNVNNSFVANKIKLLLCPFLHKSWKRRIVRNGEVDMHLPPRDDVNAPDLYIPTMAFVTYVLLVGLISGINSAFSPEELGITGSRALGFLIAELLIIKSGFYLLNSANVSILDLTAYSGYKFVGLVVNMLASLLMLPSFVTYAIIAMTGVFMAVFMVRTLRLALNSEPNAVMDLREGSMRRNYFLLGVAAMQIVFMYFLGPKY